MKKFYNIRARQQIKIIIPSSASAGCNVTLPFADLIADGATGFASGLTGGLAFAATALCQRGLKVRFVDCLNVFHVISS